jgi:hypothetical protein
MKGILQGGYQIVFYMKICGTVIEMNIIKSTNAAELYNKVAAWMNVDPS